MSIVERRLARSEDIIDGAVTNPKLAANAVKNANVNKAFGTEISQSIAASGTYTVPAGIYLASLGTNTLAEYTPNEGVTWRVFIPAGQGGAIISDGASVRLRNTNAEASDTSYLLPLA